MCLPFTWRAALQHTNMDQIYSQNGAEKQMKRFFVQCTFTRFIHWTRVILYGLEPFQSLYKEFSTLRRLDETAWLFAYRHKRVSYVSEKYFGKTKSKKNALAISIQQNPQRQRRECKSWWDYSSKITLLRKIPSVDKSGANNSHHSHPVIFLSSSKKKLTGKSLCVDFSLTWASSQLLYTELTASPRDTVWLPLLALMRLR